MKRSNQNIRVSLAIFGAGGRMGQALLQECEEEPRVEEVLAIFSPQQIARSKESKLGSSDDLLSLSKFAKARAPLSGEEAISSVCSVGATIDFTPPVAALKHALLAKKYGCPFVCGTTGFSDDEMNNLRQISEGCALVYASNFSLSVALLSSLVMRAARLLPASHFDAEIMEMHHRKKVDSPSGTALRLGESIAKARGEEHLGEQPVIDRSGLRARGGVGYGVLRGGGVVGEHRVLFASDKERLTLSHESFSRSIFARGALSSALWAIEQRAGFYSIDDVLGID